MMKMNSSFIEGTQSEKEFISLRGSSFIRKATKTEDINDPWANRVNVNICIEVDSEKTIELIKTTLTNL